MKTIALIDGDIIAYEVALTGYTIINWAEQGDPDFYTTELRADECAARIKGACMAIAEAVGADQWEVCLTTGENWRRSVLPTYKANRSASDKPIYLQQVRDIARNCVGAYSWDGLEADDMLGYLATAPRFFGRGAYRTVICSIDKDLRQIPGLHYHWNRPDDGVIEISPEEGERFHLRQTLTGDKTDNYGGCPGIGEVRADAILDKDCSWAAVVAAFHKAGLTEDDALVQARVARILRHGELVRRGRRNKPILWTPQSN